MNEERMNKEINQLEKLGHYNLSQKVRDKLKKELGGI